MVLCSSGGASDFYPRSPCGERLNAHLYYHSRGLFLSTLSLRRATTWARGSRVTYVISIHALLAESDKLVSMFNSPHGKFLSTLSLRRATTVLTLIWDVIAISIHALLAESDKLVEADTGEHLISIHALLAESDIERCSLEEFRKISIHALLAESDDYTR